MTELGAEDRADRCADEQPDERDPGAAAEDGVGHRRRRDARQEQQRVPGKEEPDQKAGFREEDRPDPDEAERLKQVLGVQRVEGKLLGERTDVHGEQRTGHLCAPAVQRLGRRNLRSTRSGAKLPTAVDEK